MKWPKRLSSAKTKSSGRIFGGLWTFQHIGGILPPFGETAARSVARATEAGLQGVFQFRDALAQAIAFLLQRIQSAGRIIGCGHGSPLNWIAAGSAAGHGPVESGTSSFSPITPFWFRNSRSSLA